MSAKAPRFPPPRSQTNPLEALAIGAIGAMVVVVVELWLTGELSGRVFGGTWPHTPFGEMPQVLSRFRQHVADPAQAWPRTDRRLIPGATAFYFTMLATFAPLVVGGGFIVLRRRSRSGGAKGGAARWAGKQDLRLLRVDEPHPGRLTLGRVSGHLVAAEPRQSVIVVGPVQTGKTSGFAVPAILEWNGPVVATSVKTDLLRDTIAARSDIPGADVWVYDPTGGTGIPSANWTPLAGCRTWQGAQRTASWLVNGARRSAAGVENSQFWNAAAEKLLAPLLFAGAHSEQTMADVIRWIDTQEDEQVRWGLELAGDPAAMAAFTASTLRDERTRSSIYTTAETLLTAFADPGVLASALDAEIQADRLLDGAAHTLYLCAPAHEQRRLQPLFATLIQEIVARAYERSSQIAGPLDPPLLLVLDECANIAPLRELATLAATGAGQGIQLVSVFQDIAQINAVYGRDRAPTIVSNHRAKVILSGIADTQTIDYVARLLGDEEVPQVSSTSGAEGRRSKTESVGYRSLAPANVLREMQPGRGLLVYGHLAPARIALRPWFSDRWLRRVAERRS